MDGQVLEQPIDTWSPSPGWRQFGGVMSRALQWIVILVTFVCDVFAVSTLAVIAFLATVIVVNPIAIAVHEAGHYLAARHWGMTVVQVRIGAVDIAPLRKGLKLRWKRYIHPLPVGYVLVSPDPECPLRIPMIVLALSGVAATLSFALIVALTIPLAPSTSTRWVLMGCLSILLWPIASLLPGKSAFETDGCMAWRWLKHPPSDEVMAPTLAGARMLRGVPVSALDVNDANALIDGSTSGVWYAVKRHQQLGEWTQAAALGDKLDALVPTDRFARSASAELVDLVRGEIAFAAAVLHSDPARLPDPDALRRARWGNPCLSPRCEAWLAYHRGDRETWQRATDRMLRVAENSVDRSLVSSERLIAEQLYSEG